MRDNFSFEKTEYCSKNFKEKWIQVFLNKDNENKINLVYVILKDKRMWGQWYKYCCCAKHYNFDPEKPTTMNIIDYVNALSKEYGSVNSLH